MKRKVEYREHVLFEPVKPRIIESLLNYLKANNHLYRDMEIDIENLPIGYSNLQSGETEDNKIYIYITRNTTQPLDIIIENPVIEEVGSKNDASCNIAINIQNDCTTQSEKFSILTKRMKIC